MKKSLYLKSNRNIVLILVFIAFTGCAPSSEISYEIDTTMPYELPSEPLLLEIYLEFDGYNYRLIGAKIYDSPFFRKPSTSRIRPVTRVGDYLVEVYSKSDEILYDSTYWDMPLEVMELPISDEVEYVIVNGKTALGEFFSNRFSAHEILTIATYPDRFLEIGES